MKVTQVVPKLPPSVSGVGDYAYLLAKELRLAHDIQSHFLVCDPAWERKGALPDFSVAQLGSHDRRELNEQLAAVTSDVVLLHYVGYGYEKRGCPIWLERGLQAWKRANSSGRLVIMFHELFGSGPVWRSSFWTSYVQRGLAARLARLADHCVTNMRRFAQWLMSKDSRHKDRVSTLPVFSTVGEHPSMPSLSERAPRAVIFGGARWVREILGPYVDDTLKCCRALDIREIVTVGSPVGTAPVNLPIPVREEGFLDADQVVEVIRSSRAGLMNYFPGYLAKSSVFAAYTALGTLPILPRLNSSEYDGCRAGKTYLLPSHVEPSLPPEEAQRVADNAMNWYREHNLARTAYTYAQLFKESQPAC